MTHIKSYCNDEPVFRLSFLKITVRIGWNVIQVTTHRAIFRCRIVSEQCDKVTPMGSHQIRKIAGFACAGNAGNVFPAIDLKGNCYLAIPACMTSHAWRTCRDACRDRWPAVAGKTFPAIPAHAQSAILRIGQKLHSKGHGMQTFSQSDKTVYMKYPIWQNPYLLDMIHRADFLQWGQGSRTLSAGAAKVM